ncbi:hypothetical protein Glove_606g134 [Diversispora epigaea]|uniref:Uncharacterized protein n=1 Tax=Diversispora epigaea TaxID=1348612 RepID=A0A397G776_9GLOM|nr:hypothetical protein Glove_606g134 [Diversispora epigaea]
MIDTQSTIASLRELNFKLTVEISELGTKIKELEQKDKEKTNLRFLAPTILALTISSLYNFQLSPQDEYSLKQ